MEPVSRMTDTTPLPYKRILLKISGEALMGSQTHGIHSGTIERVAREIVDVQKMGIQVCVVVGGGNIFRGINGEEQGINRVTGDHMGMLATVMNAPALQSILEKLNTSVRVMSAIPMQSVCEPFIRRKALHYIEKGEIVIFAAGSGNPYFTTDTAATLRATEMNCDILMKGTKVDGIYSADPMKDPDARFFDKLTYTEVLTRNLRVMDAAAVALAKENNMPVAVFSIRNPQGFQKAVAKQGKYTLITNE